MTTPAICIVCAHHARQCILPLRMARAREQADKRVGEPASMQADGRNAYARRPTQDTFMGKHTRNLGVGIATFPFFFGRSSFGRAPPSPGAARTCPHCRDAGARFAGPRPCTQASTRWLSACGGRPRQAGDSVRSKLTCNSTGWQGSGGTPLIRVCWGAEGSHLTVHAVLHHVALSSAPASFFCARPLLSCPQRS